VTKSLHRYFLWKPKVGVALGDLFFLDRAHHWLQYSGRIFKTMFGARNREGIGLLYRPARPNRMAESIMESIPRLVTSLKICAQIRLSVTVPSAGWFEKHGLLLKIFAASDFPN